MAGLRQYVIPYRNELSHNQIIARILDFCVKRGLEFDMPTIRRALTDHPFGRNKFDLNRLRRLGVGRSEINRICDLLVESGLTEPDLEAGEDMSDIQARTEATKVAETIIGFLKDKQALADEERIKQLTQAVADDPEASWGKLWAGLVSLGAPESERQELFKKMRELYTHQQIDAKWIRVNGTNGNHTAGSAAHLPARGPGPDTVRVRRQTGPARGWKPAWPRLRKPAWVQLPQIPGIPRRALALTHLFTAMPANAMGFLRRSWAVPVVRTSLLGLAVLAIAAVVIGFIVNQTRPYIVWGAGKVYSFFFNPYTLLLVLGLFTTVFFLAFARRAFKLASQRKLSHASRTQASAAVVMFGVLFALTGGAMLAWGYVYPYQSHRLKVLARLASEEEVSQQRMFEESQRTLGQAQQMLDQAAVERQTAEQERAKAAADHAAGEELNRLIGLRMKELVDVRAQIESVEAEKQKLEEETQRVRSQRTSVLANVDKQLADERARLETAKKDLDEMRKQLAGEQLTNLPAAVTPKTVVARPQVQTEPTAKPAAPRTVQRRAASPGRNSASVPWPPKRDPAER